MPQRGIFYSSRLSDRLSASYNESMTVRFTGTVSTQKLVRAIERLVERHDALRACFDETGSSMQVAPFLNIKIPVTDLSHLADTLERQNRLEKITAQETASVFTLPQGPLFRVGRGGTGRSTAFSLPIGPKASLVEAFVQQLAAILRGCLNQAMQASRRAKGDSETDVDPKQSVLTL